ncbi:MAG: enoyl-CoA hydratase-related protein [Egibacteraceae bacterium]
MGEGSRIQVTVDGRGVATVTMDRPEVRNAFDGPLIAQLGEAAGVLGGDPAVRVVVLTGVGGVFSAGADLDWMGSMKDHTFEEHLADSARVNAMLRALYDLPVPLVGRVNGHALGGGVGLVAVCDVGIAAEDARFGFPEVTLGLAPAVISPYVVRKVGHSFARAVFVTGEQFDADRALAAGLVHQVVASAGLDRAVGAAVDRCLRAGPQAVAVAKRLADLALRPLDEATAATPALIAALRVSDEGQEGMQAFLGRRPPSWLPSARERVRSPRGDPGNAPGPP